MRSLILTGVAVLALTAGAVPDARAQGQLFLYNWSNYTSPELLKKFEADTGITVTLDVYDSNETLLAKMQAGGGGYDVVVPSGYMVEIMAQEGLLQDVDVKDMPNFKNVTGVHVSPFFDPDRQYSAPYLWGTTGFSYDAERVPGGSLPDTWQSFFEPATELDRNVAALNDEVELWNAASYYLGVDKCTEDSADAQKILALLEAQKPHLALYQSDGTVERMAAGEVIMHQQWNGAAHRTKEQRPSVTYVYPREGLTFWNDNMAIPADAPNPENAKTFLNWMMAPENIAMASNFAGYMNAIQGSDQHMDGSLADDPAVNTPEELTDRFRPDVSCSAESRELRNRVWTRLKR
ncbi:extracellular solute-binding protein [Marinivivus vitaminiproducens]|uniref:extracellular solute-binding protein n=1 Tax=Marinivivus vitaminiproducens TaxID=3035935 RepID=UPI0027A33352|nr:extracellular solute-binding protein [Geminicoccaceae bacterium SCSIO 64248]